MAAQRLGASDFVISCGTVTVDLENEKVLLIRWLSNDQYMLPKGRKDIGETLEAAALRETWEETGYLAALLPLPIPTLATSPSESDGVTPTNTEPICVSQRDKDGIRKIIFWYVATGDSTAPEQKRQQQQGEDFETKWTTLGMAEKTLSFPDDRKIFQAATEAVWSRKSSWRVRSVKVQEKERPRVLEVVRPATKG